MYVELVPCAESIAFYRGEHREAEIAGGRLRTLVDISRVKIRLKMFLSLWQNLYGYATILVPSLLTAPRFFKGEIEFGVISQARTSRCICDQGNRNIIMSCLRFAGWRIPSHRPVNLCSLMDINITLRP